MQTPKHDTRDMQLKRFAFRTQKSPTNSAFVWGDAFFKEYPQI